MFDPGTASAHANRHDHGLATKFDNLTDVSIAIKFRLVAAAAWSAGRHIFGKDSSGAGFFIRASGSTRGTYRFATHTGSNILTANTALVAADDVTYSVVGRHRSALPALNEINIQGVEVVESSNAANRDPGDGDNVTICSHPNTSGAAVIVGQAMIWPNYRLTDEEVDQYHAGLVLPAGAKLGFWDKCTVEPGVDLVAGGSSAEAGTITLFADGVDNLFSGQGLLLPHRQLAGHNIRVLSCAPELYKLLVPQEYAALALGSEILAADANLPAASSLLASLEEHFMLDDFRAMNAVILQANIESNGDLSLLVLSRMPSMSYFFATAALDRGVFVNTKEEGTASLIPWATMTNNRNSQHYIVDSTEESDRARLASVGRFSTRINHRGTRFEPAVKQLVENSAFLANGAGPPTFLDTTEVLGTGGAINAVTESTIPMLFTDETIEGLSIQAAEIVKGSAGDVYLEFTLAIDTSGDDARINIWHRGAAGNFAIQRTSDSFWHSTGSTWGAGITWKSLPADADEWQQEIQAIIEAVPTSGTLKLRMGIEAGTGSSGDKLYLGQTMAYQHWAVLSDIVTTGGATLTSEIDDEVWDLDNGGTHSAQTFNPNRGGVRVRLRFITGSADIPNSTIMTLAVFGVATNAYDHFFLEKTSGAVFRLGFERVIAGVQDALAVKTLTARVADDELEVACRWTDTRGVELGLAARTLSVFEDGTKGTDDAATGIHSTSDQTTFIRWGNPFSAMVGTITPATICYIKNLELVQWVIPDEGIKARRIAA